MPICDEAAEHVLAARRRQRPSWFSPPPASEPSRERLRPLPGFGRRDITGCRCPRVNQSGDKDRHGPLTKHGPNSLRRALLEATMHACGPPPTPSATSASSADFGLGDCPYQRRAPVVEHGLTVRYEHPLDRQLDKRAQQLGKPRPVDVHIIQPAL